jgi:hypothetical protein
MAFIFCDDHNLSIEADNMDVAVAKQFMFGDRKPQNDPTEKEVFDFGATHRACNIRILAD